MSYAYPIRLLNVPCAICGAMYSPNGNAAKTCSPTCASDLARQTRRRRVAILRLERDFDGDPVDELTALRAENVRLRLEIARLGAGPVNVWEASEDDTEAWLQANDPAYTKRSAVIWNAVGGHDATVSSKRRNRSEST